MAKEHALAKGQQPPSIKGLGAHQYAAAVAARGTLAGRNPNLVTNLIFYE